MNAVLLKAHYFPCLEYFAAICQASEVVVDDEDVYYKQTYRNRCVIRSANKVLPLVVPVSASNSRTPIREVTVDHSQGWVSDHWRSIMSAYGKAPFFEHYQEPIQKALYSRHRKLFDLNIEILTTCLHLLGIKKQLKLLSSFHNYASLSILDLRSSILPKKGKQGYTIYRPYQYQQVFGKEFDDNLSIIDLLMCEGQNSLQILRLSTGPGNNK